MIPNIVKRSHNEFARQQANEAAHAGNNIPPPLYRYRNAPNLVAERARFANHVQRENQAWEQLANQQAQENEVLGGIPNNNAELNPISVDAANDVGYIDVLEGEIDPVTLKEFENGDLVVSVTYVKNTKTFENIYLQSSLEDWLNELRRRRVAFDDPKRIPITSQDQLQKGIAVIVDSKGIEVKNPKPSSGGRNKYRKSRKHRSRKHRSRKHRKSRRGPN